MKFCSPFVKTHESFAAPAISARTRIAGVVITIAVGLALGSCSTNTLVYGVKDLGAYDKTVPEEQSSNLVIPVFYTVTDFDDKQVEWGKIMAVPNSVIRIPAGEHKIKYKYAFSSEGCSAPRKGDPSVSAQGCCSAPRLETKGNKRVVVQACRFKTDEDFDAETTMTFVAGETYAIGGRTITGSQSEPQRDLP